MGSPCRRRRCLCCNELFTPDYRNRSRQRFCSKAPCKRASKKASQAAWLDQPANQGYFGGPSNTERNRQWRDDHPGYWRSSQKDRVQPSCTQQDACSAQPVDNQPPKPSLGISAQQETCLMQVPVLVGLMSILTDSTQQDDIDQTTRHLHLLGCQIQARSNTTSGAPSSPSSNIPTAASP